MLPAVKKFGFCSLLWCLMLLLGITPFTLAQEKANSSQKRKKPQIDSLATVDSLTKPILKDSIQEKRIEVKDSVIFNTGTVGFIYRDNLFFGLKDQNPDTLINNLHRYSFLQQKNNTYQDLGNLGTPMNPIFYEMPDKIGTRWGASVFEPYILKPHQIRFFNTLSPYTELNIALGGQGKSRLGVDFARNINPEWSVGFLYRKMSANYVVGKSFRKNDLQNEHQTVGLFTRYFSPKRKYKLLASFLYYNHISRQTGGFTTLDGVEKPEDLLNHEDAELDNRLQSATALQYGRTFSFHQQYQIAPLFQIYQSADISSETWRYRDADVGTNKANSPNLNFYDSIFFTPSKLKGNVDYQPHFKQADISAGIIGSVEKFAYQLYAKTRWYNYDVRFIKKETNLDTIASLDLKQDKFIGAKIRFQPKPDVFVAAHLEYLLFDSYQLQGILHHPWFRLRYQASSYAPDIQQQRMFGNFLRWDNTFDNINTYQLTAETTQKPTQWLQISPFASYLMVRNYVYYDSMGRAKQATKTAGYWQVGFRSLMERNKIRAKVEMIYSQAMNEEVMPVPAFLVNASLFKEHSAFDNKLMYQIGVDVHWKSRYYANGYMPHLQQFYVQQRDKIGSYVVLDAFANLKIRNVSLFLKIHNILQDLAHLGYFDTPYYLAQPRSFEVGVRWRFFD